MPRGDDRGKKKTMENIFFKPWIGEDYETGGIFGKKILVVGESHYCGHCERCGDAANAEECAGFTTDHCIQPLLDGYTAGWTGTFHKFERSLVGHETDLNESRKIWNSVAFYNYIQKAMDGPRTSPDWTDFRDAEAAFFETLDSLRPDVVIVWGVGRMFDNMPGGDRWREGGSLEVGGYAVKNGFYRLDNDREARVLWVYHPSAGYSWDWWYKVIKTEL